MSLTEEQIERYSRHIILEQVGGAGQEKLLSSKVLIIGAGGLGDKQRAFSFIDSLKLAKNLANLGDAKTLVLHPASTIFHEFSTKEQNKMGVSEDMVRVSVGIEDFEDIKADFQQAIERAFKETK